MLALLKVSVALILFWNVASQAPASPAVEAVSFDRRAVYRSSETPAYTSWASLFPGQHNEWYLSFEEVRPSDPPLPRVALDKWHGIGLPHGYDKSPYRMEIVLLKSSGECKNWQEIARNQVRFQHSSGPFGQVRTHQ